MKPYDPESWLGPREQVFPDLELLKVLLEDPTPRQAKVLAFRALETPATLEADLPPVGQAQESVR
jgi:hypothetical protein